MSRFMQAIVPPPGARGVFAGTAAAVALVATTGLLLLPQGGSEGDPVGGETVAVELGDGVSATLEPALRDQGWRATNPRYPYALDLALTVTNDGDDTLARWFELEVEEVSDPADPTRVWERRTNSLGTAHVPAGESATVLHTYAHTQGCGEFVATLSYYLGPEDHRERHTVEIPFTIDGEGC